MKTIEDLALEVAAEVYGPLKGGAVLRMREFINKFMDKVTEQVEPTQKMFQVIGMNVLKEQAYQDGWFIANGDEGRICEMFYKHLRYPFAAPKPNTKEGPPEMSDVALTIRDLEFERDDLRDQLTRYRAVMEQALETLELADYHLTPNINISAKLQQPIANLKDAIEQQEWKPDPNWISALEKLMPHPAPI